MRSPTWILAGGARLADQWPHLRGRPRWLIEPRAGALALHFHSHEALRPLREP